jgi:hypothetical protein
MPPKHCIPTSQSVPVNGPPHAFFGAGGAEGAALGSLLELLLLEVGPELSLDAGQPAF